MVNHVDIVGAGISGLVAGTILARRGHSVRIFESSQRLGGRGSWSDSTLIDPSAIKTELGLDIDDALEPWTLTRAWAYDRRYEFSGPRQEIQFTVERGGGEASIDNVLYRQALEAGVEVVLSARLSKEEITELPPDTIIATGLDRDSFEVLDIPCRPFFCHLATGKSEPDRPSVVIYLDRFTREFGYYCQSHAVSSSLVFSVQRPLVDCEKEEFKSKLAGNDGIVFDDWSDDVASTLAWPLGTWGNQNLFRKGKIVAGTLAGAVSPVLLFGVNGAIASGRIAALAVTDKDAALREHRRMAPLYVPQFLLRKVREYFPHALLMHIVRGILSTYDSDRFPYVMEFVLWPPGLKTNISR